MKKWLEMCKDLYRRHAEVVHYLFFGALCTAINIGVFAVLKRFSQLETDWINIIAWLISVLFAYVTNRLWVFQSKTHGQAALREFAYFMACRLLTGVIDQFIVVYGVDVLLPRYVPEGQLYLWSVGIKVFSNVLVIIANYVFSKLLIFRKKKKA